MLSLAHFGGVGLKEVEASGAVTLATDHAGTEREVREIGIGETRGIGLPTQAAGKELWAGEPRYRREARVGERQARVLGRLRHAGGDTATCADDASMRARIATDARLLGTTQD